MNSTIKTPDIRLTQYSHGAGCGCKISPQVLDQILSGAKSGNEFKDLIVGNDTNDDAAVFRINDKQAIISTTDFFMPIVDDAYDFGRIAATNAISDIYAMGGAPVMAIAMLGWPVDKLPPEIAGKVIEGARSVCADAGMPLAGGHSIDTFEPIFGLAVTGLVNPRFVKKNNTATEGCLLFLTKPLGIGILTTAEKKQILKKQDVGLATEWMLKPNVIGKELASLAGIMAMTDVTGFGLLGHLIEICEASGLAAEINSQRVPVLSEAMYYQTLGSVPGGTGRNFSSYGQKVSHLTKSQMELLCDPQTSGGLLVAVDPKHEKEFLDFTAKSGFDLNPFGVLIPKAEHLVTVL